MKAKEERWARHRQPHEKNVCISTPALSLKRGLPLSILLNQHFNTKAKQELLKVQEESASPPLKAKQDKIKQVKEIVADNVKEEKGGKTAKEMGKLD